MDRSVIYSEVYKRIKDRYPDCGKALQFVLSRHIRQLTLELHFPGTLDFPNHWIVIQKHPSFEGLKVKKPHEQKKEIRNRKKA